MEIKLFIEWHGNAKKVKTGRVILYQENEMVGKRLGYVTFVLSETQIFIDDLRVHNRHRRRGFGRLIMMAIMALAEQVKKPIFLFATDESVEFYESIGMRRIWNHEKWNDVKVEFMNLNPKKKFCEQCSDMDFVWIPSGVTYIQLFL